MDDLVARISINQHGSSPLGQQLYTQLYRLILSGDIAAGEPLPTSRALSRALGISRVTVTDTYEQLKADGYVSAQSRKGTRVSTKLPPAVGEPAGADLKRSPTYPVDKFSAFAQSLITQRQVFPTTERMELPLYSWDIAFDEFPLRKWSIAWSKMLRNAEQPLLEYPKDPRGLPALRRALAANLKLNKGINVSADEIIIVSGWQQGLDLLLRIHARPNDAVAIENPSFPMVWRSAWAQGAEIRPINVDEDGLKVSDLTAGRVPPKIVYVTPSHQFPTGAVMSPARRMELLRWARSCDAVIVEDEHDSSLRFTGHPIPALKTLDEYGSVLYLGSFSKALFPSVGLGYIIVPPRLVQIYSHAKAVTSDDIAPLMQQFLANLISDGELDRHLKRMKSIYAERRHALLSALEKRLGKRMQISGDRAGLHFIVKLESKLSTSEIVAAAKEAGVGLVDSSQYYFDRPPLREFVVGFAGLTPAKIQEAVRRLAAII